MLMLTYFFIGAVMRMRLANVYFLAYSTCEDIIEIYGVGRIVRSR